LEGEKKHVWSQISQWFIGLLKIMGATYKFNMLGKNSNVKRNHIPYRAG
jgi:hypothetical protein